MKRLHSLLLFLCYHLFRVFPIRKDKIFFENYFGRGYGCNPKYICEALRSEGGYCLVWQTFPEYRDSLPTDVRWVKYNSIRSVFEQATSKVWVCNVRRFRYIRKRKNQIYIQTWHGAIGIKRCEGDAESKISPRFLKTAKHDSPMIDLMISNSTFCTNVYKRAFWYGGPIAEFGYPRNDFIVRPDLKTLEKVRSAFSLEKDSRIFLYAPTFRKDSAAWNFSEFDIPRALSALEKRFGGNWVCLLRLHPWAARHFKGKIPFTPKIVDATYFPDIQELLAVADCMATDYSSCIFDFLVSRKPAFMFAPDIDGYVQERGFLFDPFQLPFPCATDNDGFEKAVLSFEEESYHGKVDTFFQENGLKDDGFASARSARFIERVCGGESCSEALREVLK